jgi:hypothetical protein
MRHISSLFILTIITGCLYFTVYLVSQQMLRQGANDPQIQLAEDNARAIANGASTATYGLMEKSEMETALAPFIQIYDASGKLIVSTTQLHGIAPSIPSGVLDYAKAHNGNRLTWQPERGVRMATVVAPITAGEGGYVVAGRSLRLSEERTLDIGRLIVVAWAGTMLLIVAWFMITRRIRNAGRPLVSQP